jgi:ABC-type uncharacterized transport system substrate-binding protein
MKGVAMLRLLLLSACTALFLNGSALPAMAHPHVWIECELKAEFGPQGLMGFRHRWVLDEMFSASILPDIDLDKDRVISPRESETARKVAFDNLKEYGYFTDVRIDGKPFKVQFVKDFRCTLDSSGRLVYEFFVPCTVQAGANPKSVTIAVYDNTYFCDVAYAKGTPKIGGNNAELTVESKAVVLGEAAPDSFMPPPKGFEFRFRRK